MQVLILSFSNNQVNEDSFIPNKIGLTFSCVEECEKELKNNVCKNTCNKSKFWKTKKSYRRCNEIGG